jgi:sugar phosphate isomerase/epimerase
MHICLNRATTGGSLPLEKFVDIAASAGFQGADVDLGYAQKNGSAALRDIYESKKMTYGGWGLPFDWRGDPAGLKEGLRTLSEQAKIAGELRIDSCATWLMPSSDLPLIENWRFHVARLGPAAQVLADNGMRLGLEFIGPYHHRRRGKHEFLFTPGQMLELADAIGSNAGLLVDSFHVYTSGTTFEHLSQIPAKRIVLAHLNDAPPGPIGAIQDSNRFLPGEGVIDLNAFMDALAKAGYDGPVSLEVFSAELRKMTPADAAKRAWGAVQKALPRYATAR